MKKKVQHLSKTYYESHNIDNSFTSGLKYQFQNTSLSKFAEVKKQQLTHQKTIKKTQEKVEKNKVRKRNLVLRFASMEARLKSANSKLQDLKSLDEQMEASSILIQKVFKGFITRKRLENAMIQVKRETTVKKITRMSIKNDHYMRNVGKMPNLSAICIQKAYRRYRIRCKLYRLKQTYETLQVLKEEENYRSLREKIRNIYCYTYIKTLRFERYRRNCLALIRKNLARIKIKIVFRKLKLKFPIIIAKIKKYKRRLRAALKRKMRRREGVNANNIEGIFEHSSTLVEEKEASINSEEDFETTTSDREAEEREEMLKKMEEERKMRIHFGKISYNCPDFKLPKILTSLHQKEVNFPTESSPLPTISPIKKKKIINFESKRRKNLNDGPSYMRATVSYNLSKSDAKQDDYEPFNLSKVTPRENSTVMDPTKTYLLKVTHKRSASTDEGAKNFHFGDAGTSSPKLISVKIAKKKNFPKKWTKQASEDFSSVKPENVRFSMTLPDISTQYNQLPLKVKPRAQIMKGFAKSKKIPEYYFDI